MQSLAKYKLILIALVFVPLLGYLYRRSVTVDPGEHYYFIERLRKVEAWENALSRDLLKTTYGLLSHVGPAGTIESVPTELLEELHKVPAFIDPDGIEAIRADLKTYGNTLERKVKLLEEYKHKYAILRNSLRYYPSLSEDLANDLDSRGDRKKQALLLDLQSQVLLYHMASAQEVVHSQSVLTTNRMREQIETSIGKLRKLVNDNPNAKSNKEALIVINHVENILFFKSEIDKLLHVFNIALQPQSSQIFGSIKSTYNHYYEIALTDSNQFRLWLFICSCLLVTVILVALLRLGTISENLKTANLRLEDYTKNLERMVQTRTLELKAKNEALEQTLEKLQTMRDQMVIQEKMASLGALTAGIAHEIQEPLDKLARSAWDAEAQATHLLSEIRSKKKMVSRKGQMELMRLSEMLSSHIEVVLKHEHSLRKLIHGMMMHAQAKDRDHHQTDLNTLIEEFLRLSYYGMKAKDPKFSLVIEKDLDPEVENLTLQVEDMAQVLINLFNNAFYALQARRLEGDPHYEPKLIVTTKNSANRVVIRVRDNGPGIPQDIRNKIFKPFFTTKPLGEGTGLGLSISWEIITQGHQGELKVQSEEGAFTEFTIVLPKRLKPAGISEKTPA